MLAVIALTISLSNCCPMVNAARAAGLSDHKIEQLAREKGVPAYIIAWAKRNCKTS